MLDSIMDRFYDMGKEKLAYAGMDDAGEMSSWYVFNAIGLHIYSPADTEYIITVPLFDKVEFEMNNETFTIEKRRKGKKISNLTYDEEKVIGWFISHQELEKGKTLIVETE